MIDAQKQFAPTRRAFTVTEMVIALGLFGAVLGTAVPLARESELAARRVEARRFALIELSNRLVRLTADPEAVPASGEMSMPALEGTVGKRFPNAQLTAQVVPLGELGRRIDLSLAWTDPRSGAVAPAKLSGWLPREEEAP